MSQIVDNLPVEITLSFNKLPPQRNDLSTDEYKAACHGNCPFFETLPPTINLSLWDSCRKLEEIATFSDFKFNHHVLTWTTIGNAFSPFTIGVNRCRSGKTWILIEGTTPEVCYGTVDGVSAIDRLFAPRGTFDRQYWSGVYWVTKKNRISG